LLLSDSWRILISEQATVGNSAVKTGGLYSLLGSTSQLGSGSLTGGRYTVSWGTVNSWRPAQANVDKAHIYPNPCNIRDGCSAVTFTLLTLRAQIDVYTVSGERVKRIEKVTNIDSIGWDLRNDSGRAVASGLYLYLIRGENSTKRGKFILIR